MLNRRTLDPHGFLMFAIVAGVIGVACSRGDEGPSAATSNQTPADASAPFPPHVELASEPQRGGDAERGRRALLNEPYVPCGIPKSTYRRASPTTDPALVLPGREGDNASLPYFLTAMKTKEGVDLVTSNCLQCHAGELNGKLIVGLGDHAGDFTSDRSGLIEAGAALVSDPKERAEYNKWKERMITIAPYARLSTRGPNPADSFTAVLFAHHDPKTLAWSSKPLIELLEPKDVPVDVPPWWTMKKRASMFRNGAGRGDHARIMMTASILCTSSVEESRAIDAYFPDIRAFILSLEPPKFPFAIDASKASAGRVVFEATCSGCHGRYGESGSYPNKLVSLEEVGTDPFLARDTAQFAAPYAAWFNASFFGELARLEPKEGYVAPPLDGIWASAPYLHNGAVPTLEGVIDSSKRPVYWRRTFDSRDYDAAAVGWRFSELAHGKEGASDEVERVEIYDTTIEAYGRYGHTFGDRLNDTDRGALLEYLKTL